MSFVKFKSFFNGKILINMYVKNFNKKKGTLIIFNEKKWNVCLHISDTVKKLFTQYTNLIF